MHLLLCPVAHVLCLLENVGGRVTGAVMTPSVGGSDPLAAKPTGLFTPVKASGPHGRRVGSGGAETGAPRPFPSLALRLEGRERGAGKAGPPRGGMTGRAFLRVGFP